MTTAAATKTKRYHEDARADFDRIDREAGIIYGVRVLGLQSKNRRRYLKEAVAKAMPLYEGQKVYLNHGALKRMTGERWGKLVNVRIAEDGGLQADLEYLKEHPETKQLLEAIERFKDIGLSHDSEGLGRREQGGGEAVYEIAAVHSVDVVEKPATTKNFFEEQAIMPKKLLAVLREQSDNETAKALVSRLKEMDGDEMGMDMGEVEMEVAPEMSGDDAVKEAIRAAVMAILDADDDAATSLSKIKMLLKIKDEVNKPAEPPAVDPVDMAAQESEILKLRADLQQYREAEDQRKAAEAAKAAAEATATACRKLLEELNREETPVRMQALVSVPEDARKSLVESWNERKQRPAASPARFPTPEAGANDSSYEAIQKRIRDKHAAKK